MATTRDGLSGPPTSSNGASSHHVFWQLHTDRPVVAVTATLEIVEPPTVDRLYFWALQATFRDGDRATGGAHLGLQHHPGHPDGGAANWGGYHRPPRSGELDGSPLTIPSALHNPNTGDYRWRPHRTYRLDIERSGPRRWTGSITDDATGATTSLRELHCAGDRLSDPIVWTECFADCDAPTTTVRWSELAATTVDGTVVEPDAVRFGYQSIGDGGCATATSRIDEDARSVIQRTGVLGD